MDALFHAGKVLAIVGSRELQGDARVTALINDALDRYAPALLISGGCVGVDRMAVEAADLRGIKWREYLPAVENWEQGYKPRNIDIAEACDYLVRIASRKSKSYGSGFTRDWAARLGKPTEEHVVG